MTLKYREFYDSIIEGHYAGASISPTVMEPILGEFLEWVRAKSMENLDSKSASDAVWQVLSSAQPFGFDPLGEVKFTDWIIQELNALQEARIALAEAESTSIIAQPPTEMAVYSDVIIYQQEGQTQAMARKRAGREREMAGPNSRVFFHGHQPGEPCVKVCKEIPDGD